MERWYPTPSANMINGWFLTVVALWRVLMYGSDLWRVSMLRVPYLVAGLLCPFAFPVTALTIANVEQAVFDIMRGAHSRTTPYDEFYEIILFLTLLAVLSSPVLVLIYACGCVAETTKRGEEKEKAPDDESPRAQIDFTEEE